MESQTKAGERHQEGVMAENLNASRGEALLVARLVNAYSAAQTVLEQLQPVMKDLGLLRENGSLNADRVLAVHTAARATPGGGLR